MGPPVAPVSPGGGVSVDRPSGDDGLVMIQKSLMVIEKSAGARRDEADLQLKDGGHGENERSLFMVRKEVWWVGIR